MISKLERRAAEVLEPVVAEMAAAIVEAPSAHIDETSWSEANEEGVAVGSARADDPELSSRSPTIGGLAWPARSWGPIARRWFISDRFPQL